MQRCFFEPLLDANSGSFPLLGLFSDPLTRRWLVDVHACLAEWDVTEERWPVCVCALMHETTGIQPEKAAVQNINVELLIINPCCSLSRPVEPVSKPPQVFL